MYDANVLGTERVLRAALAEKAGKVVYISTVAAFGNTRGQVVDEAYEHPAAEFTSYYEETKYRAHQVAKRMAREEGLPLVIVQPGGVYGPEDHSELGNTMNQFLKGRLPVLAVSRPRPQPGARRGRGRTGSSWPSTRAPSASPTSSAARSRRCGG